MDRFARALVRWRWVVLVVWAVIGAVAAVRAPATPVAAQHPGRQRRGRPRRPRTEDLLSTRRFSRPIGEFFAITLQAPASLDEPARAGVSTRCSAALGRRAVRARRSSPTASTGDTTFLSRDHRATFLIVALKATRGDSAGALVRAGAAPGAADPRTRSRRRHATGRRSPAARRSTSTCAPW